MLKAEYGDDESMPQLVGLRDHRRQLRRSRRQIRQVTPVDTNETGYDVRAPNAVTINVNDSTIDIVPDQAVQPHKSLLRKQHILRYRAKLLVKTRRHRSTRKLRPPSLYNDRETIKSSTADTTISGGFKSRRKAWSESALNDSFSSIGSDSSGNARWNITLSSPIALASVGGRGGGPILMGGAPPLPERCPGRRRRGCVPHLR